MLLTSQGTRLDQQHARGKSSVVSGQDFLSVGVFCSIQQWMPAVVRNQILGWIYRFLQIQTFLFMCLAVCSVRHQNQPGRQKPKHHQCKSPSIKQGTCKSRWIVALIIMMFLHCGEASNPGPPENQWTIGAFNPSGLNGKQQIINEHLGFGDIWAISETHLSSRAFNSFKKGLYASGSEYSYCVGGCPAPPRPRSDHVGAWTGVAMLSKHPTRALPVNWPQDVYQSSRVQITATLCNDLWITGGVVYGEPPGQQHPNARENTEIITTAIFDAIMAYPGLRFLAGDFNFETTQLDVFHLLHQQGFRDLQDIAKERWACEPQFTCKGKTRKDFCFISPELQAMLVDVVFQDDVWSDHSVMAGVFKGSPKQIVQHWWRQPNQLSWPESFQTSDVPT